MNDDRWPPAIPTRQGKLRLLIKDGNRETGKARTYQANTFSIYTGLVARFILTVFEGGDRVGFIGEKRQIEAVEKLLSLSCD